MILNRMILGLQGRALVTVLVVLMVLALIVDFFEQARFLLAGKGAAEDVLLLILYRLPSWLYLLFPVSLIASTCIVFSQLGRSSQLRAIASAGISPFRLAIPFAIMTAAAVLAMGLIQEFLVPPALNRLEPLMMRAFGRVDSTWRFFRYHQWYQGDGDRLFRIDRKSSEGREMEAVTILEMDSAFNIKKRIDLQSMAFEGNRWVGVGVEERLFVGGRQVARRVAEREVLALTEEPDRFEDLSGRPQQKCMVELSDMIGKLQRQGWAFAEYVLAWHNRLAYPLVGVGLLLFAFPWLAVPWRRRTLTGALTEAMALTFGGYVLVAVSTSAVSGGLLSPVAGAWIPVAVVFLAAGPSWYKSLVDRRAGL